MGDLIMKRYQKTVISLILAFVLVFAAVGCKKNKNDGDGDGDTTAATFTDIVLADSGSTDYKIVVPAEATAAEDYAAELLAGYFEAATGAAIQVVSDEGIEWNSSSKYISVGQTTALSAFGVVANESVLNRNGFVIKRFGNAVVACGGDNSGTIYSAQEFLKYEFGYEVYASDEIYIEETPSAKLFDFNIVELPDFWNRSFSGVLTYNQSLAVALRYTNASLPEVYGEGDTNDWIPNRNHTYRNIIPTSIYRDSAAHPESYHPEWFSGNQICLTNEELIDEFVKRLKEMILANPKGRIVNMAEEDMGGFCSCETCINERRTYTTSGYVVRFTNKVIEKLEAWRAAEGMEREWVYTMFAYTSGGTIIPPTQEVQGKDGIEYVAIDPSVVPHEKLYIRITPLQPQCYYHPLDDENCAINKVNMAPYLKGWSAITTHFMVWDYDADFKEYLTYFDRFSALQANLRLYRQLGVENITRQGVTGSRLHSMSDYDAYITSKLMWDVDADVATLTDEFFKQFYKSGAEYMRSYFELMRAYWKECDVKSDKGYHFNTSKEFKDSDFPIRVLEQALALINAADATYDNLKATDPELYEKMHIRTLKESVCIRTSILDNYSSYYNISSSRYTDLLDEFERDAETVGATQYNERTSLSEKIAEWRG